jgi:hypothetical protein
MGEYFVVAIEGSVFYFTGFTKAFEKYQELKAQGYYEAVLRKHSPDYTRPLIYSDRAKCFFA